MLAFLSFFLIKVFSEPQCTNVDKGAAGTCAVCDPVTNLCQTCNYADDYEPNDQGDCSLKPTPNPKNCVAQPSGAAGTCSKCDETTDKCIECNYPNEYELDQTGACVQKQKNCVAQPSGAAGTCSKCDETTDKCIECNYPNEYELDQTGACVQKQKNCVAQPSGAAGTCSKCDETTDKCIECNYPNEYELDQNGSCVQKQKRCIPQPNGPAGACDVCDDTTDLCKTCNFPDEYEPDQLGACTLKFVQPVCVAADKGAGGTCEVCDGITGFCQRCNYPEMYEPNKYGNCTLKTNICTPEIYGAGETCNVCNYTSNKCLRCNYPDLYQPNEYGNCTLKKEINKCESVINGAGGTCSVCSSTTNLCQICNYPNEFVPNELGNCTSRNGCSPHVSNCRRCDPSNPDVCLRCEYLYGLRGGYCTKCPPYLYDDSKSPCRADCSTIPNCHIGPDYDDDDCVRENGEVYCMKCNKGFHPSDDYKSCIMNDPSKCEYPIPGCLECGYPGSNKCTKCDASNNFYLDDGECECRRGFELIDGTCVRAREVECARSVKNCDTCAINSSFCIECDDDYGLYNGTCVKCPEGAFSSGKSPCMIQCNIPNCEYCREKKGELICQKCMKGFQPDHHHKRCVDKTPGKCQNVPGCSKCSRSDPTYCLECDEKNHFDESEVFPGKCVCDDDYDYVNGQCVFPSAPVSPPSSWEEFPIAGIDFDKYVQITQDGLGYIIVSDALNNTALILYILIVPINIKHITIPRGPKHFQLNIPHSNDDKFVTISADSSTEVDLSCVSGARLIIPEDNNYVLKGSGIITLNPPDGQKSVILRKISLEKFGNSMTLVSEKAEIKVKEIEVFGQQAIVSQVTASRTVCEIGKIQSGSVFTPENITFSTLKAGIQSVLFIKGNSGVAISNYQLYYNSSSTKIPMQFVSPFPDFSKSKVQVFNMNQNEMLQEDETFTIAQFSGEGSKEACESLSLNKESDFKSSECQTQGSTTVMVVKRSADDNGGKKKKLSAGAIAGIVVACVVVVALVIFLCVYFLYIKKNPHHKREGEPANSREKLEV